jgi:hypothetical protein
MSLLEDLRSETLVKGCAARCNGGSSGRKTRDGSNRRLKEIFERGYALPVTIDPVFFAAYAVLYCYARRHVEGQTRRHGNIGFNRFGYSLCYTYHRQDSRGVAASHQCALKGYNRQVVSETFKRRVASRPADTVEEREPAMLRKVFLTPPKRRDFA